MPRALPAYEGDQWDSSYGRLLKKSVPRAIKQLQTIVSVLGRLKNRRFTFGDDGDGRHSLKNFLSDCQYELNCLNGQYGGHIQSALHELLDSEGFHWDFVKPMEGLLKVVPRKSQIKLKRALASL